MSLRRSFVSLLTPALALGLALCLAPRSPAQEEKKPETGKAVSSVPAKSADALLVVINDPLPQLKALLGSESLRKVLTEGALAELVGMLGVVLDPSTAWDHIDENRRYVPSEITIALSQESVAQIDRLVRAGLFSGLALGAVESEDEAAKKDLAKLHDELLKMLKEVGVPPMTVAVRLREAEDAERLFDLTQEHWKNLAEMADLEVTEFDDGAGLGLRGKLAGKVPEEEMNETLAALGIDEARRPEFRKAISELKAEIWVQRLGNSLRFTVGPRPEAKAAGLTAAQLGPLFRLDERDMVFARWDATKLKSAVKGWIDLWKQWEKTPAGKQIAALDKQGFVARMVGSMRPVEQTADSGSMRIWSDDDALRGAVRSQGAAPSPDLQGAAISRYIPKDVETFSLDSTTSIADLLSAYVDQFEMRLALQSLQAEIAKDGVSDRLVQELTSKYNKHFTEFRKNVLERLPEAVGAPTANLVTTTGQIDRFTASITVDGEKKTIELKELPMIEMAAISRAKDPKKAEEVLAATYKSFIEGIAGATDKTLPEDGKLVVERDLGLGVKTRVFTGDWIKSLSGDFEIELAAEGDFVPHYFVHDGHLVVSTSPKLSKRILAAAKEPSRSLPPTKTGYDRTVAYGVMPGRTLGNIYSHMFTWIAAGVREAAPPGVAVIAVGPLEKVGKGISELFELIDRVEWTTSEKTGSQDSDFSVRWAKK
jgi:hypothetical protein